MIGMWFEMRVTEDEKKKIWKKLQNNKDKKLSAHDMLGDSNEVNWNNFKNSVKMLKEYHD